MKKVSTILISVTFLFFAAASLYASGDAGGSSSPIMDFFFKVINFVALIAILYYFAKKPIALGLKNSAQATKKSLDDVRAAKEQAEKELDTFRQKMESMKQEAQAMVEEAKKEAEKEKERIIEEGKQLAESLKKQVQVAIEQEYRKAELDLKKWTAGETVKMAETLVKEKADDTHHKAYVKNFLDKLN
ncbi:MAG: hypothetical protein HQM14_21580 [SAR324 cluster bacterium]|nr:hypothetical protein [SAR324 cluster bacterium]